MEFISKLNEEQLKRLESACDTIHNIFTEEDNGFDEMSIDEYYSSELYKGIQDVMYEVGRWC